MSARKGKSSDRENRGSKAPKKSSGEHRTQKQGGNGSKKY